MGNRENIISRHMKNNFSKELGIKLTVIEDGYAEGEIVIEPKHLNPYGIVHGGCIFTLIDTIGGIAAFTRGNLVVTSSGGVVFTNPSEGASKLIAKAVEVKAGNSLLTYDISVFTDKDVHVAKSTIVYFKLDETI